MEGAPAERNRLLVGLKDVRRAGAGKTWMSNTPRALQEFLPPGSPAASPGPEPEPDNY